MSLGGNHQTLTLFFSYMPQQSLIVVYSWMSRNPKSLCYIFNSLFHSILITYGVYLPAYFIARRVLFYICVQLYYFQLHISVINILDGMLPVRVVIVY